MEKSYKIMSMIIKFQTHGGIKDKVIRFCAKMINYDS